MHLHPAVVHFVVGLIIASAGFEVLGFFLPKIGLRQAALWTLIIGAVASWVAMLSGRQDVATLPHSGEMHEIIELHQRLGTWIPYIATFLAGALVWITISQHPKWARGLCTLFLVLLASAIGYTGWLGGTAVFVHGMGVAPMTEVLEAESCDHEHGGSGNENDHSDSGEDHDDEEDGHAH